MGWTQRFRPVRLWILFGNLLVGLVCGLDALVESMAWLPPTWVSTAVALREGASPWIIAASVLAAMAARSVNACSLTGGPWTARAGWDAVGRQTGLLLGALGAGWLLSGGSAIAITAVRAEAGGVLAVLAALISTLPALAFWPFLGYAIGALAPRGWGVLVAALTASVVWLAPALAGPAYQPVALVWGQDWPVLGDRFAPPAALFRLAFLTGLCGSLVIVAARLGRRFQGSGARVYRATTATCLLPVLVLGVVGAQRIPVSVERELDFRADCSTSDLGVEVCVHEGHRVLSQPLTQAVEPMVVLANTTHPMQLVERAVATSDQVEGSIAGPGGGVLVFEISDPTAPQSEIVESIAFLVAASLGGVPQCNALVAANGPGVVPMSLMHGQVAADAIAAELTDRAGMAYRSPTGGAWADSPLAYGLADLSDVDFESWIDTHREEISECSLSELDSP